MQVNMTGKKITVTYVFYATFECKSAKLNCPRMEMEDRVCSKSNESAK